MKRRKKETETKKDMKKDGRKSNKYVSALSNNDMLIIVCVEIFDRFRILGFPSTLALVQKILLRKRR